METFPNQTELLVAKALLLLYSQPPLLTSPPPPPPPQQQHPLYATYNKCEELSPPSESKSCCSTLTSGDPTRLRPHLTIEPPPPSLKIGNNEDSLSPTESSSTITSEVVSSPTSVIRFERFNQMKIKIVKRNRSKHYRSTDRPGDQSTEPESSTQAPDDDVPEDSSVSNASSMSNAVLPSPVEAAPQSHRGELKRRKVETTQPYLTRRADAILRFLAAGCASEVQIREGVGNTPDTSKALRMLLKGQKVKRFGAGGTKDPYIYMVQESGSEDED